MRVELNDENTTKLIQASTPTGHSVNAIVNKIIGRMQLDEVCETVINIIREDQKKLIEQSAKAKK